MTLRVVTDIAPLRTALAEVRRNGPAIGLVPTMGALHAGHLSLIEAARAQTDYVVVSIFVNPTQFGPKEDFRRYPRPLERDLAMCEQTGVDLVFHPEPHVLYPPDFRTYVEVTELQEVLEGTSRPGHFRGVATVVLKLFNLVQPDRAFFGQKDAQQVRILQQIVDDLNVPVQLIVCPIVREADGLALSSRNDYLEAEERRQASILHRVLCETRRRIEAGERDAVTLQRGIMSELATAPRAVVDYVAVVDADSLQSLAKLVPERPFLLALAVRFGTTRLIDNLQLRIVDGGRIEAIP